MGSINNNSIIKYEVVIGAYKLDLDLLNLDS